MGRLAASVARPMPLIFLAQTLVNPQIIAAVIMTLVMISFIRERVPPEITALGGFIAMVLTGVLPAEKAARVFSNEALLMIASLLVLCLALERTGWIAAAGRVYEKVSAGSPKRGLWMLMVICGLISPFLNNTSIVIIFLPVVMSVCRRQGLSPSRLLIPFSFATVAGGMVTLIGTSTNMVVSGHVKEHYGIHFSIFEISGLGLAVFAVSILYLGLLAPRLLPDRSPLSTSQDEAKTHEYLTRAFVSADSPLIGKVYVETPLGSLRDFRLIEIIRRGAIERDSLMELKLEAGDQLILKGRLEDVLNMRGTEGLEVLPREDLGLENVQTEEAVLMEAVLGPGSPLLHKSLREMRFRQRYGVLVVAVHRKGVNLSERFEDMRLLTGDTLLLEGPREQLEALFRERGFINPAKPKDTRPRLERRWMALGIMLAVCLLGTLAETQLPDGSTIMQRLGGPDLNFGFIALAGAVVCVLARCVDMEEVYAAMEWRILLLIVGTVGIGAGMQSCGLADTLADWIVKGFSPFGHVAVLAALYFIAVVLTEFLSNTAVAAIITPIAVQTARGMELDPKPFIVAAMFGATLAFSTPIGYQTNLLVYNAGGYRFSDFCRVGIPLTLLLWILCSLLIPLIWPFTATP